MLKYVKMSSVDIKNHQSLTDISRIKTDIQVKELVFNEILS